MAFNKNFLNTIGLFLKNVNSLFVYLLNTWSQRGEGTCCRTSTLICVISEVIKRWRWCIIICSLFVVLDEALYVGWHLGRVECRAPHWRIWKTNKHKNTSKKAKKKKNIGNGSVCKQISWSRKAAIVANIRMQNAGCKTMRSATKHDQLQTESAGFRSYMTYHGAKHLA